MTDCKHTKAVIVTPEGETVAAKLGPFVYCPACEWTSGREADRLKFATAPPARRV